MSGRLIGAEPLAERFFCHLNPWKQYQEYAFESVIYKNAGLDTKKGAK